MTDTRIPTPVFDRVDAISRALPEVTARVDRSRVRTRSTAYSYDIRRRSFCLLVAGRPGGAALTTQLVLRVDPADRRVMVAAGHPFHRTRAGRDRVRVVLDDGTDWTEVAALVAESYRLLAPKKLIARLP